MDPLQVTPPTDLDVESRALGAVLYDTELAETACAELLPTDFSRSEHRQIFEAIRAISSREVSNPLDMMGLERLLSDRKQADAIRRLHEISVDHVSPAVPETITWCREKLRELAEKRWLRAVAVRLLDRVVSDQRAEDVFIGLRQTILSHEPSGKASRVVTFRQSFEALYQTLMDWDDENAHVGATSGIPDLDTMAGPVPPGWLVIIAGRPSMGKTLLSTTTAYHLSAKSEPVLYVTLEMTEQEITRGILAPVARVAGTTLKIGPKHKIQAVLPSIDRVKPQMLSLPIHYLEAPASLADIRRAAQDVQAKEGRPLGAVFVDRLEYIEEVRRAGSESEKRHCLSYCSANLKDMATTMNVPVFLMVQFNRKSVDREQKRPMLSDLRDSGTLEENAQRVIGVHRPEEFEPNNDDVKGIAELLILKNKGRTGTVTVRFDREFPAFFPLAKVAP